MGKHLSWFLSLSVYTLYSLMYLQAKKRVSPLYAILRSLEIVNPRVGPPGEFSSHWN